MCWHNRRRIDPSPFRTQPTVFLHQMIASSGTNIGSARGAAGGGRIALRSDTLPVKGDPGERPIRSADTVQQIVIDARHPRFRPLARRDRLSGNCPTMGRFFRRRGTAEQTADAIHQGFRHCRNSRLKAGFKCLNTRSLGSNDGDASRSTARDGDRLRQVHLFRRERLRRVARHRPENPSGGGAARAAGMSWL